METSALASLHLDRLAPAQLAAIAAALGGNIITPAPAAPLAAAAAGFLWTPQLQILDEDVAFDRRTNLYWTRAFVAGGERNHEDSMVAAAAVTLRGWKWRAPEVWERLSIVDYTRSGPALDPSVFREKEGFEWTKTKYEPLDGYFWCVGAYDGYAHGNHPGLGGFVRAVSPGQ